MAIAGAASLIASVGSAVEAHQSGIATAAADRQKATAAALNAGQQQINLREKLLQSLAAQNAGTLGAVGTGAGSGFAANAMRQITQNQNDLAVNSANESSTVSLLDEAATNATAAGNLTAVSDTIGGIGSAANIFAKASQSTAPGASPSS
jgi:hypothetical protein